MSEIDPRVRRALDRLEPFRLSGPEREALLSDSAVFTGQDDFRIPVMPQGRGRSSEGGVSFHFKRDIVSRHAVPILNGKPYLPGGGAPRKADKFEAYLRRDDSAEDVAVAQLMYISRPGAEEAISDEEAEPPGGFPSIISNISTVAAQREDYWRTVWDHLTPPTTNYLIARPEACPGFWATLDEQTRLPQKLLTYLLATRAAYLDYQRNLGTQREKFRVGKLKVSAEEAGEFLAAVRQSGPRTQPILFKSGRGGRHQYQMAIELPHTLPPAARWRIMNAFCQQLRSLGLMYTAAHHRAGDHGDRRNCHFHVIFHDRPAGLMRVAKDFNARTVEHPEGPPGAETILLWDFDVAIPAGHKKNARRPIYPFAQAKIDFVSQSWRRTKNADSGRGFFKWLRAKYGQIVNAALEKYGETYRYDPRKYNQMGVGWTPTEHLGPKLAALEAQGIATLQGSRNAVLRYQDLEKDLATECRRRIQAATSARKDVERSIAQRGAPAGTDAYLRAVAQTREIIEQQQATAEWSLRLLALRREAAESRAFHADAAPYGDHVKRSRRQAAAVNERAERANGYIERLEEALEPTQAGVKEIEAECAERQKQLEQIDGEIERRLSSALFAASAPINVASLAVDATETRIQSSPNPPSKPAKPSGQPANEDAPVPPKAPRLVVEYRKTAPGPAFAVVPVVGKSPERSVIAQSEAKGRPSISLPDSILQEPVVPSERIGLLRVDGAIEKVTGDGGPFAKRTTPAPSLGGSTAPTPAEGEKGAPPPSVQDPSGEKCVASGDPGAVTLPLHQPSAAADEAKPVNPQQAGLASPQAVAADAAQQGKLNDMIAEPEALEQAGADEQPTTAEEVIASEPQEWIPSRADYDSVIGELVKWEELYPIVHDLETGRYDVSDVPPEWIAVLHSMAYLEETQARLSEIEESRKAVSLIIEACRVDPTRIEIRDGIIGFPDFEPAHQALVDKYRDWPNVIDVLDFARSQHEASNSQTGIDVDQLGYWSDHNGPGRD
jgi:hypothetical protein